MKVRKYIAILIGFGIVTGLFSGCKSTSQNIQESTGTGVASHGQKMLNDRLISGPYTLSDNLDSTIIMDASSNGRLLLCNHDEKYYVVQIGETGECVSSVSVQYSDDIRLRTRFFMYTSKMLSFISKTLTEWVLWLIR